MKFALEIFIPNAKHLLQYITQSLPLMIILLLAHWPRCGVFSNGLGDWSSNSG